MMTFDPLRSASRVRNGVTRGERSRSGFSLIEVMIATAILMGSAIVLARLAGMGREQSQKAKLYSDAQQMCELTMNELLLGLRPMDLVESMPLIPLPEPVAETLNELTLNELTEPDLFAAAESSQAGVMDETNPEWRHSVRMELLPHLPGMWSLTVVVTQGDETLRRPIRFSLTRWISGPPPEGAFEELSQGADEPALLNQGGLL